MCEYFACMYVCAPHACPASAHGGQRKVLNPGNQSYVRLVMIPRGYEELNKGPLQELHGFCSSSFSWYGDR